MPFCWRRLPHIVATDRPVFLTWRLHGSLPAHRFFRAGALPSGEAFVAMDRLLDEARSGPMYLRQEAIAEMVVETFFYGAETLELYELHAFVVMPNHVHLLVTAGVRLATVTKSLKGITARRANEMLGMAGATFWQAESYDHEVRNDREFWRIKNYIEENPVRAGLVRCAEDFRWSSAGATWRSRADLEVCPTTDSRSGWKRAADTRAGRGQF